MAAEAALHDGKNMNNRCGLGAQSLSGAGIPRQTYMKSFVEPSARQISDVSGTCIGEH